MTVIHGGNCQNIWSKSVFKLSAVKILSFGKAQNSYNYMLPPELILAYECFGQITGTQNACRIGRGLQRQNFFYQKISVWGKKRKLINYSKHSRLSHYRADILNKNINNFICTNHICSIFFRISQRN